LKLTKDYKCYYGFYGPGKVPFCGTYNIIGDTIKLFFKDTLPSSMTTIFLLKEKRIDYLDNREPLEIITNNIDSFIPPYPTYQGLTFSIQNSKPVYKSTDSIIIKYSFLNSSKYQKYLLVKKEMGFPMGMSGLLTDEDGNSVLKYSTRQIYSSLIYSPRQLLGNYLRLKPGVKYSGQVDLLQVVELNKGIDIRELEKGRYHLTMTSYQLKSNEIIIKIE
jgi:hypothetical protein